MPLLFPSDWPTDCPPKDATDAAGEVYRIVKERAFVDADFATHFETGKMPKGPPCLRCGLSVFRSMREALHQLQLFPNLGSQVARATLQAEHGKTKLTEGRQPTHTTWWIYEGVKRASLFSVAEEEN